MEQNRKPSLYIVPRPPELRRALQEGCDSAAGPVAELSVTGYAGGDSPGGAEPDPSSKATLWVKAQHEGALALPGKFFLKEQEWSVVPLTLLFSFCLLSF